MLVKLNVRMYDDLKCKEGDNPTLGILLCSETDEDIARYSILHDNDRLFMSKYLTYLPSKEQLKAEIDHQKEIFYMQHPTLSKKRWLKMKYERSDFIWPEYIVHIVDMKLLEWMQLTDNSVPPSGHVVSHNG